MTIADSYLTSLNFDPYQFAGQHPRPVSAETRLDYSDYQNGMHLSHRQIAQRRKPAPEWALRDDLLRQVIVRFLEHRAGIRKTDSALSLLDRLQRAQEAIRARRKIKKRILARLCKQYVRLLPKNGKCAARRRVLEMEIEALDTFLSTTAKDGGAALVAAIVFLYHRCRMDSVGIAMELNLKPPSVRQTLYRLGQIWKRDKFIA